MISAMLCGCGAGTKAADGAPASEGVPEANVPEFSGDSAYANVEAQLAFGPRNPGSEGHEDCGRWLVSTLGLLGADTVIEQRATVAGPDGKPMNILNIMGQYNADAKSRVVLLAHWDTRPWADEDPDPANHAKPLPGANDGASGVGVLLEVARLMSLQRPQVGVDLLFVDAEDSGSSGSGTETTWCIGTQYWVRNMPYALEETPRFGVLLDMVGGNGARFHREAFSDYMASGIVDKVWAAAERSGFGSIFVNEAGDPVIDDHVWLNRVGIPAIDIIECRNATTGSFPPAWHTMADDIQAISPATLKAVGQTITYLIYTEK